MSHIIISQKFSTNHQFKIGKVPTADKMKGCAKYKKFCKAPKYSKKLSAQCAFTCNVCVPIGGSGPATTKAPAPAGSGAGAGAASGECRDGTPKQCPQLKRYCKVGKYKTMMMKKCKATCGFCGAGGAAGTAPGPKTPPKTPATGGKIKNRLEIGKTAYCLMVKLLLIYHNDIITF